MRTLPPLQLAYGLIGWLLIYLCIVQHALLLVFFQEPPRTPLLESSHREILPDAAQYIS